MVICDVQNRRSPPRGRFHLPRRQDTPMQEVKEELEDVKPLVIPPGYELLPALHGEAHDSDCLGMSWALVASATKIEKDSRGFMEIVQRFSQMASACTSYTGASTSRAHQDGDSTSRAPRVGASISRAAPPPPSSYSTAKMTTTMTTSTCPGPTRVRFVLV